MKIYASRHLPQVTSGYLTLLIFLLFGFSIVEVEAASSKKEAQHAKEWREAIPFQTELRKRQEVPIFVAVAHGGRILVSNDDGRTWTQNFFAFPGEDHGFWACKSVAYTDGIFVVGMGWGAPATWLASDDGVNWVHLNQGIEAPTQSSDKTIGPDQYGIAGGGGVFVSGSAGTFNATLDFGKSWEEFNLKRQKGYEKRPKMSTHHVKPIYLGDESGKFLALGDDRGKTNYFGHLFVTEDKGKTWRWLEPTKLYKEMVTPKRGKAMLQSNGKITIIVQNDGAKAWCSIDEGETWFGPFETGASGKVSLSEVNGEFWLVGTKSRRSPNGKDWSDLPKDMPEGQIIASETGALISYQRNRYNLMRSDDGGKSWNVVHEFEAENTGGAVGIREVAYGKVSPVRR